MWLLFHTLLVACFFCFGESVIAAQNQTICQLGTRTYAVGQSWHPEVPPFGIIACTNCTCELSGTVTCESEVCDQLDCKRIQLLPGKCCPVCRSESNIVVDNTVPMPEPTEAPRESCLHDDITYHHSQIFSTTNSGLRKTKPNQCVLCICLDGDVLCHLKTCPNVSCSDPYFNQDDCCPHCPGNQPPDYWQDPWEQSHVEDHLEILNNEHKKNISHCMENGKVRHKDGTSWHPMIGPFGAMKCVICSCQAGEVHCRRMQCVPKDALPCKQPSRGPSQCCATCLETNSTDIIPAQDPDNTLCLHAPKHSVFVAKVQTKKHILLFVDEGLAYNWYLDRGKIARTEVTDLTEVESAFIKSQLQIATGESTKVGFAKRKVVTKFKKKVVKLMKRCAGDSCNRQQLYKVLKKIRMKTCHL